MHREIQIYMPNLTNVKEVEELKSNKPFVMRAHVPKGAKFLGVTSIPSIVDMMGFSGGGGPPGYAFAVPETAETDKQIFVAMMPNTPLPKMESLDLMFKPLGVTQCVGMLFGHFRVHGKAVQDGVFEDAIENGGCLIVDMIKYEIPALLHTLYNPNMEKRLGGVEQDEQ